MPGQILQLSIFKEVLKKFFKKEFLRNYDCKVLNVNVLLFNKEELGNNIVVKVEVVFLTGITQGNNFRKVNCIVFFKITF